MFWKWNVSKFNILRHPIYIFTVNIYTSSLYLTFTSQAILNIIKVAGYLQKALKGRTTEGLMVIMITTEVHINKRVKRVNVRPSLILGFRASKNNVFSWIFWSIILWKRWIFQICKLLHVNKCHFRTKVNSLRPDLLT